MSTDARFMVIPVFDGLLAAFAGDGQLLWQRFLPPITSNQFTYGPGHNALAMTPSGDLTVVGTKSYQLLVYDRTGSLLWSHTATLQAAQTTNAGLPYPGVNSAAISSDGRYVAGGYRDNVIRIFRRQ